MIPKELANIEKSDIDALLDNEVKEGRALEYKQLLPGNTDNDKKEFLADVTSFANAAGGDLLFGVSECAGVPDAIPGLAIADADAEIQRLDSILRSSVEPRIPGVQIRTLDGYASGPVLIVRIPRSWAAPHMVTFKGTSRFFTRNNAGKHQMDVGEIRAAFTASESLPERIRQFRDERLGRIVAGDTPLPMLIGAKLIMHILPVQSFTQPPSLDMRSLSSQYLRLPPLFAEGWDMRFNLDGLLTFNLTSEGECVGYAQLFRNGAIETVDCALLHPSRDGSREIPTVGYERELILSMKRLLNFQEHLGVLPPVFIFVSMTGVKDYAMTVVSSPLRRSGDGNRVDRDTLLLPDVMVESFDEEPSKVLRPVFDAVWQSAGFQGCPNFDDAGVWVGN